MPDNLLPTMTSNQADMVFAWLEHGDYTKNLDGTRRSSRGNPTGRMCDALTSKGLWRSYNRRDEKNGKPKIINRAGPTALGMRVFKRDDGRASMFPKLATMIAEDEAAQAEWDAKVKAKRAADKAASEQFQATQRAKKVAALRAAFTKIGLDVSKLDDDGVIANANEIWHADHNY